MYGLKQGFNFFFKAVVLKKKKKEVRISYLVRKLGFH